eukprot:201470_1
MYDKKILYKSKKKGNEDPPPRNWKCIEGSLPPPGVSMVALPDDSTPMVIFDEDKKAEFDNRNNNEKVADFDDNSSVSTSISRMSTIQHGGPSRINIEKANGKHSKKKSKSKRKSKSKKK